MKRDRVLGRVYIVRSEVDARAERGFFVFFRRSFEFVPRRKPHSVGSINLDRVMAITSENHETMRMVSIVRHARPSGRSLSARVRPHVPRNGRRLRSCRERSKPKGGEKDKESDLHVATLATDHPPHNLIVLNASLSVIYVFSSDDALRKSRRQDAPVAPFGLAVCRSVDHGCTGSACCVLSPALLTCNQHFVQVRCRPYLDRSKPILKAWKL